jgi:hypothetical protein
VDLIRHREKTTKFKIAPTSFDGAVH